MASRRHSGPASSSTAAVLGLTLMAIMAIGGASAKVSGVAVAAVQPAPSAARVTTLEISRGDTLHELLEASGIVSAEARRVTAAIAQHINPMTIRAGNRLVLKFNPAGNGHQLHLVKLELDADRSLELYSDDDGRFFEDQSVAAPDYQVPGLTETRVRRGDTIASILTAQKITPVEIDRAVRSLRTRFDPRRLKIGQVISVLPGDKVRRGHELAGLGVHLSDGRVVEVLRGAGGRFVTRRSSALTLALPLPRPQHRPNAADQNLASNAADAEHLSTRDNSAATPEITSVSAPADQTNNAAPNASANGTPAATTAPDDDARTVRVRPGDTVGAILEGAGITPQEKDRAVRQMRKHFNPRHLRVGQEILLRTSAQQGGRQLDGFAIRVRGNRYVEVINDGAGKFRANRVKQPSLAGLTPEPSELQPVAQAAAEGLAAPSPSVASTISGPADAAEGMAQVLEKNDPATTTRIADTDIRPVRRPGSFELMEFALTAAAVAAAAPIDDRTAGTPSTLVADALEPSASATSSDEPVTGINKEVVIERGDTLFTALARAGTTNGDAEAAIKAFRKVHDPRRLQIGQVLSLNFGDAQETSALSLSRLALNVSPERDLVIERENPDTFLGREVERPIERQLNHADGVISSSLYLAAKGAGLPNDVLMEMVHIFGFAVDFQRDIQSGDQFEVLYEQLENDRGENVGNGPVLYASITLSGSRLELFRYEASDGSADYFEPTGKSVRRALMRTPINGARLSSGYGMRRHPVLGYSKMHRGLDFAAPRGTPIMAAGDGTIERIGRYSTYGKYIRIRHNGAYSTAYAHMNGYAKGLKAGSRVRQGQIIGYVGTTGRSTGPHLHYEILSGGKQTDPRKVKLPSGRQLDETEVAAFHGLVRKVRIMIAEKTGVTRLAASD